MSKYGILLRGLLTDWTKYIIEEYEEKHQGDKTGKSMTYNTRFKMLSSGDFLEVSFYDWSKKMEDENFNYSELKGELVLAVSIEKEYKNI